MVARPSTRSSAVECMQMYGLPSSSSPFSSFHHHRLLLPDRPLAIESCSSTRVITQKPQLTFCASSSCPPSDRTQKAPAVQSLFFFSAPLRSNTSLRWAQLHNRCLALQVSTHANATSKQKRRFFSADCAASSLTHSLTHRSQHISHVPFNICITIGRAHLLIRPITRCFAQAISSG